MSTGDKGERRSLFPLLAAAVIGYLLWTEARLLFGVVLTPSIPRGLYLKHQASPILKEGDLISFCPPPEVARHLVAHHLEPSGGCPGGSIPLAKKVLAIEPHLCSSANGLRVNDRLLPWPRMPLSLRTSFPKLRACGPTGGACIFVIGSSPDSIDSRSYGCIARSSVLSRLTPVLVEAP